MVTKYKTVPLLAFLVVTIILAAFFASASPDGLEFVAGKLGFLHKRIQGSAILLGYTVPSFEGNPITRVLSALVGIAVIFGLFWAIEKFYFRRR
jgi:hypothetical protein